MVASGALTEPSAATTSSGRRSSSAPLLPVGDHAVGIVGDRQRDGEGAVGVEELDEHPHGSGFARLLHAHRDAAIGGERHQPHVVAAR